jgi:ectoine hydroxylase-related dioxygenase (phytanoyl-CoA dioxygenase family)
MPATDARVRRHDLNRDFAWSDRAGPFRRISAAQARAYDELGCFVLEDAFSADEVAAVVAEIDPFEAEVQAFLEATDTGTFFIARANEITFTTHLVARSPALRAFTEGPVFQDLAADLIGDDVRMYWDQAVYKKPGTESPFPWHQDNGYAFVEPQQYLTCWIALTDATLDNGCPWVVPGLHRYGTLAHESTDLGFVCLDDAAARVDAVPVEARAGSIVVFSSLTPHCTGANRTDEVRKSYIVQLAPDGAAVRAPDGTITPADDPSRQYPILVGGQPAA